ncbi:discoidin domain-containing protein, partial [Ructibacterium gallinarum]
IQSAIRLGMAVRAADRFSSVEQLQNALNGQSTTWVPTTPEENHTSPSSSIPYSPSKAKPSSSSLLIAGLLVGSFLLLLISIITAVTLFRTSASKNSMNTLSSSTVTVTPTPAPTITLEPYIPPQFTGVSASNVTSSSGNSRNYHPELVLDNSPATAWNVPGGTGEWILLTAQTEQQVKGVRILNGYTKFSPDYNMWIYAANSRPKDITVSFSDGTYQNFTLSDVFDDQNYIYQTLDFGGIKKTTFIKITINSIYPGTRWSDCCISEIQVF